MRGATKVARTTYTSGALELTSACSRVHVFKSLVLCVMFCGSLFDVLHFFFKPLLQTRRQHQRLIFFYKVVEGQIPAIPPHEYIRHQKPKRHIRARTFQDCETTNIINSQVRNNTRAIVVEHSNTVQYRNSIFIRTSIDWNHLENSLVIAKTTD